MASLFANLGRSAKSKAEDDKTPKDKRDDDEAEKARKAKRKAKGEDDDDDDEDEDAENSKKDKDDEKDAKASAARCRERARVRAILTSGPGLANPVMAAHMALDTDMPRGSAVCAIGSLNAAKGIPDAEELDSDDVQASTSAVARAIIAAGAKARGEAAPVPPGRRQRMGYGEGYTPPEPRREGRSFDAHGRPVDAVAQRMIDAGARARGEGPPQPAPRRQAYGPDGRPVDATAQRMVEMARNARGEA